MLSPGPANMCMESSKAMKHDLWQNQLWLKRKAAAEHRADSDEDDTEQFGIQEGAAEGTSQGADDAGAGDEDEGDVYPLYGQDDSDFGDSSSDVSAKALLLLQCSLLCMVPVLFSPACANLVNVSWRMLPTSPSSVVITEKCWHAHLLKHEQNAKHRMLLGHTCMFQMRQTQLRTGESIALTHNRTYFPLIIRVGFRVSQ